MRLFIISFVFLLLSYSVSSFAQEKDRQRKSTNAFSFSIGRPLIFEKRVDNPAGSNNRNNELPNQNVEGGIGFNINRWQHKYGFAINYRFLSANAISLPNDFRDPGFLSNKPPIIDLQHSLSFRWTYRQKIIQDLYWIPELGPSINFVGLAKFTPRPTTYGLNYEQTRIYSFTPGVSCLNRISLLTGKSFALDVFVNSNINLKFSYTSIGTQLNFGKTNRQ